MPRFEWRAAYSVGDPVLDEQHRRMLGILDRLAAAFDGDSAPRSGDVRAAFDALAGYIVEHFAYEEQRIADAGYPEECIAAHRGEHDALLGTVQEFERAFERGDLPALDELMPFLYGDWLIHHICDTDRDYVAYLDAAR